LNGAASRRRRICRGRSWRPRWRVIAAVHPSTGAIAPAAAKGCHLFGAWRKHKPATVCRHRRRRLVRSNGALRVKACSVLYVRQDLYHTATTMFVPYGSYVLA
jgi:phosphoketolase